MILPKMDLQVGDNLKTVARNSRLKPRWAIMDDWNKVVLLQGFDNDRDALATHAKLVTYLCNQELDKFFDLVLAVRNRFGVRVTPPMKMMHAMYEENKKTAKHGHKLRKQGAQPAFAAQYGQAAPAAAKDPKTEKFINISGELGYPVQDLHEMDDRLKNWVADLVDMSAELDDTGDIAGLPDDGSSPRLKLTGTTAGRTSHKDPSASNVPQGDIGQPVPAVEPDADDSSIVELDTWDVMAGRKRSSKDLQTTKKEWEPDTIDPNVDPLKRY